MSALHDPRLELFARELAAALNDAGPASQAAEMNHSLAGAPELPVVDPSCRTYPFG